MPNGYPGSKYNYAVEFLKGFDPESGGSSMLQPGSESPLPLSRTIVLGFQISI